MPQVTVYIREDDLDQWRAIEKKSEFIHEALEIHYVEKRLPEQVVNAAPKKVVPKKVTDEDINRIAKKMDKETKPTHITPTKKPEVMKSLNHVEKPEERKFPPSILDNIHIPPPAQKKIQEAQFIPKDYTARKKGSKLNDKYEEIV